MKCDSQEEIKKKIGYLAAEQVESGMLIGLGTGSTAYYFIEALIKRCQQGLKIAAVATSKRSYEQASAGGIHMYPEQELQQLDLTVDGADEIDPKNCMIKGGGGALAREKILASSSKKMIVLVDESKQVTQLGKFGVPVELLPFCYQTTVHKIKNSHFDGKMRKNADGSFFVTDNGNYIFDIHQPTFITEPKATHLLLSSLPGVLETGLFFDLPVEVMVGYKDGTLQKRGFDG